MSAIALPADKATQRPALLNVGTIVWLASELMFFSGLFAAYFTLRAHAAVAPADVKLDTTGHCGHPAPGRLQRHHAAGGRADRTGRPSVSSAGWR